MAYLARGGLRRLLDGHDRLRPLDAAGAMNDPCNLAPRSAGRVRPGRAPCAPSYPHAADDDRVRLGRHRRGRWTTCARCAAWSKVSLVGWSLGGPRAGGYAAQHPEKVHRLVLLAPAYNRERPPPRRRRRSRRRARRSTRSRATSSSPTGIGRSAVPISTIRPRRDAVWAEMLASDPVGATWGPGVRRAPQTTTWGWNQRSWRKTHDADADGRRRARQAGAARARARALRRPRRAAEGARRSRLLVAQRDVGEESPAAVPARRSSGSPRARSRGKRRALCTSRLPRRRSGALATHRGAVEKRTRSAG